MHSVTEGLKELKSNTKPDKSSLGHQSVTAGSLGLIKPFCEYLEVVLNLVPCGFMIDSSYMTYQVTTQQ